MKLSNYIMDLGRVVAYYPNLKHITGSTTATIFLSQLLYWTSKNLDNRFKDKDGWIYKNAGEIEEETGLTYNEQKTAKKELSFLKLIAVERKPLDHTSRYKVLQDNLNDAWEKYVGKESESVVKDVPEEAPLAEVKEEAPARRSDVKKKGDLVDGALFFMKSPAMEKEKLMDEIKNKIATRLHVNPEGRKWDAFISHAYTRQTKFGEPVDKFLDWAVVEKLNPMYNPPDKLVTLYPQAFIKDETDTNFLPTLPSLKTEEENVSMPRNLIGKK